MFLRLRIGTVLETAERHPDTYTAVIVFFPLSQKTLHDFVDNGLKLFRDLDRLLLPYAYTLIVL